MSERLMTRWCLRCSIAETQISRDTTAKFTEQTFVPAGRNRRRESRFSQPLTVHLKSVGLEKFLVAVCVTGVVAHVGRCHLGDVQRAVISKVLPDRVRNKRGGGGGGGGGESNS